ncbi:alpha/beta hydrolase [Nocardia sp. NPDC050712]|uniref:alpha/beta hydrolase n=1 Tax=Nocardia sp. NPDC050712 TaxID=3155518 RepID=UPI0033C03AC2
MRDMNFPLPVSKAVLGRMFPAMLNARLPFPVQRKLMDVGSALQWLPDNTVVHRLRLAGRPAEKLTVRGKSAAGAVLYLHGGGYTVGSLATHRSLAARLAHETGCAVYLLDYRLAPEHPFPAGLEDATAAFRELVEQAGYRPDQIALAGDSAGGGLSLATAQRLIAEHGLTPAALGLIAPWTDPNVVPEQERDLVINRPWSRACAAAYLGDGDGNDPGYAPLRGELHGLPPTYVQVDVSELLHSQCVELVGALRTAGVHVRFTESQGLWHVAQAQAAFVAAAAAAVRELSDFLKEAIQPVSMRDLG